MEPQHHIIPCLPRILLVAEDTGKDIQLSGSTEVTINVMDINDNEPRITNVIKGLNIPHSIVKGIQIHMGIYSFPGHF